MDLAEFADGYLGAEPSAFFAGNLEQYSDWVGGYAYTPDAYLAQPFFGSLFWQAFTQLHRYSELLNSIGLSDNTTDDRQEIIVRHGDPGWSRYDLVVLDAKFVGREPVTFTVTPTDNELARAASSYWQQLGERGVLGDPSGIRDLSLSPDAVGQLVAEAARLQQFHILVTSPPPTVRTAIVPAPDAWEVVSESGDGASASAGVVATDRNGRSGVTTADHAFSSATQTVKVAGTSGAICSRHSLSDSCFIELPLLPALIGRPTSGPLSRRSPGEGDTVTFNGATSGPTETTITGWDKGIPFEIQPWNRLRVLTKAVTSPGDSGAALVASDDEVIGFAFDRTGYGTPIEYSAWIWAEFVYLAHGLH
jgi:hypothetical protein